MRIAGWILTVFAAVGIFGNIVYGHFSAAQLIWLALGIFLIDRGKKKAKEKKEKDEWNKNE